MGNFDCLTFNKEPDMNENKVVTLDDCIDASKIREIQIDRTEREAKARKLAEESDNTRRILGKVGLQPDRIDGCVATILYEGKDVRLHVWAHRSGDYHAEYGIVLEVGVCEKCGNPTFTDETFSHTPEAIGDLLRDPHPRRHNHEDDDDISIAPRRRNRFARLFKKG